MKSPLNDVFAANWCLFDQVVKTRVFSFYGVYYGFFGQALLDAVRKILNGKTLQNNDVTM